MQPSLTLLVVAIVGCTSAAGRDRQGEELASLERLLVSPDESDRTSGHEQLLDLCCPLRLPQDTEGPYAPACRRVEAIVATTNDAAALHGLVRYPWRVECMDALDTSAVLSTLARPVVEADEPLREKIYWIIENSVPTAAMLDLVFAEYKRPAADRRENALYAAARVLASLDEDGLARLLRLMTEHPDVRARRLATHALMGATSLPLDVPGLEAALDLATRDRDEKRAIRAGLALSSLQRTEQAGLQASVATGLESEDLAVFGRRRRTCFIPEVERKLQEVSQRNGPLQDKIGPRRARLALAARRTYCRAPADTAKASER